MRKSVSLFDFIPLIKIKDIENRRFILLFNLFPLISVKYKKNRTKYYLFGFIHLITVKDKEDIFDGYNNEWTDYNYKICAKVGKKLYCGGKTILSSKTYLGDFVCFNGCEVHGGGKVTIGNNFRSGVEILMITRNHNYDNGTEIPYASDDYVYKDIEIGDFVWIGSRVMILPGTKIGKGAIIQGGAVVHGEIPPYAIAGGNPAKVFKYRNKKHFDELEKKKCFRR